MKLRTNSEFSSGKPLEHRSALTPTTTKALLDAGYIVNIERSPERIFDDSEFKNVGATLVPEGSWVDAPTDHIVIGLKELPVEDFPLKHTHVQFAHCYKNQGGWEDLAAAWQLRHPAGEPLPGVSSYANEGLLIGDVKEWLANGSRKAGGKLPQVLVIGADSQERSGPFSEIIESDIFVNCIYLASSIPPFVDMKSLESPSRKLSVVCDVSCDTTNPYNPIPIYTINSTFANPTVPVKVKQNPPLSVISIGHLPSLLPREASEAFSSALLPSLLQLKGRKKSRVWQQAEQLFSEKVATLPK
ncbi:MAG: Saccharopine dehydrogenase [Geoglossum umbratile]|nr:MAG: Saccharopine dehydrogenase [Geoglossum umbratile]